MTDLEIANGARLQPVLSLAHDKLGIEAAHLAPYGHDKAKLSFGVHREPGRTAGGQADPGSAITPTPAGEGKTTTTIGLGDGLSRLGKRCHVCLREPALGPCCRDEGGGAGGGRSQVAPMADINLHFTGDLHAVNQRQQPAGRADRQPHPP